MYLTMSSWQPQGTYRTTTLTSERKVGILRVHSLCFILTNNFSLSTISNIIIILLYLSNYPASLIPPPCYPYLTPSSVNYRLCSTWHANWNWIRIEFAAPNHHQQLWRVLFVIFIPDSEKEGNDTKLGREPDSCAFRVYRRIYAAACTAHSSGISP